MWAAGSGIRRVIAAGLIVVALLADGALGGSQPAHAAPATPTLTTAASVSVTLGNTISDTAMLTGGVNPTGTISFRLYGPDNATCSGSPVFSPTVPVTTGDGAYSSRPFTPTMAGTYQWTASYNGDANNAGMANVCGASGESSSVTQATALTLSTVASPGGSVGAALTDTATLAGGAASTGSISFTLFGPDDPSCATTPVFTASATVTGNVTYASGAFTPAAAGTYRWTASYSGDANNAAASSPCNAANESATLTRAVTTTTLASSSNPSLAGGSVTFSAAVSCPAATASGTVTFSDGGTPLATVALAGGTASFTTSALAIGTHSITAAYLGDAACAPSAPAPLSQLVGFQASSLPITLPSPAAGAIVVYTAAGQPGSVALYPGCNEVVVRTPAGTPISAVAALASPAGVVASVWRFDNGAQTWRAGYFSTAGAPLDFSSTSGGAEAYAVCVSGPATITGGPLS